MASSPVALIACALPPCPESLFPPRGKREGNFLSGASRSQLVGSATLDSELSLSHDCAETRNGEMAATTMTSADVSRRARALALRAWKVLRTNWHLGVTAFGGPPVHFRIVSLGAEWKEEC